MAVIDLFTDQNQLDSIRDLNWLVNEANLTFYVGDEVEDNENQPDRLFIYDINNNQVLSDYTSDISAIDNFPFRSREIHLGPLQTDDNGDRFYKIRVTGLVNNIINNDSTNTRLGLSVSTNVNNTQITSGRFGTNAPEQLENIPQMQVITPEGTILHGTNPPANESSRRLKLNIFYTQPE